MRRVLLRFIASSLILGCIWAAGFGWFITQVPAVPTDSLQVTDAVIVLTGGSGRVSHGLNRVKQGLAKQIFISGVNDDATAEHVILGAITNEVPELLESDSAQLVLGYQATSTIGNADETKKWVEKNGVHSIRLVTANYHMPRSMLEFRRTMPKSLRILPDPVFPEGFERAEWWRGGNSSHLLLSEYHKYVAAYLRHSLIAWHKKL